MVIYSHTTSHCKYQGHFSSWFSWTLLQNFAEMFLHVQWVVCCRQDFLFVWKKSEKKVADYGYTVFFFAGRSTVHLSGTVFYWPTWLPRLSFVIHESWSSMTDLIYMYRNTQFIYARSKHVFYEFYNYLLLDIRSSWLICHI